MKSNTNLKFFLKKKFTTYPINTIYSFICQTKKIIYSLSLNKYILLLLKRIACITFFFTFFTFFTFLISMFKLNAPNTVEI